MLRLVLLGSLRLEDDEGPMTGRASQKRRLAVLALLAVPPGHLVTRDKLIGYLWPETDDERARRSLSTALWELRRELGEEAIRTPGDEIGLDPDLITSDAAAFIQAVERDELEEAIELYGGPFLDGVYIGASAEFEHWVDEERRRYEWKYREALEKLARGREEAGDRQGAVDAWRRLANVDRLNKRVALGYMQSLWANGEGARALQFLDVHRALLGDELGAEPDAEVLELAERIRQEPAPAPPPPPRPPEPSAAEPASPTSPSPEPPSPEPQPPAPRPDPHRVEPPPASRRRALGYAAALIAALVTVFLVLVLANRDDERTTPPPEDEIRLAVVPFDAPTDTTGMVDFPGDLADAISGALSQVEGFLITGQTTVKALQGLEPGRIADSLGVGYLIGGGIAREGDSLRIRVHALDENENLLWSGEYDHGMGSLFEVEREVADSVVAGVAARLAGIEADDEELYIGPTTEDTAALRHFRAARRAWNTRTHAGLQLARDELRRAVDLDSTYARAYAALADVYNTMGAFEYGLLPPDSAYPMAREAARRALVLEPDLPEARAALGVALFNHYWQWDDAERQLSEAIRTLPSEVMPRHWYASLLRATGHPVEAVRQVRYAQERDPESPVVSTSLCRHHYFDGDLASSAAACEEALSLDPGHVMAYLALGLTRVQQGEFEAALHLYDQADSLIRADTLIGSPTPAVLPLRAHALGAAGDTAAADIIYQQLRRAAEAGTADRYVPPQFVALAAIGAGRLEEAVDWLARGLEERSPALIYMQIEPVIDPLRELPSYRRLVERAEEAGLPPVRGARAGG
jgi:DNA-binding SARP family transcriptional activator/TolB-like protein/Tfp pilus assembly protein PilF